MIFPFHFPLTGARYGILSSPPSEIDFCAKIHRKAFNIIFRISCRLFPPYLIRKGHAQTEPSREEKRFSSYT